MAGMTLVVPEPAAFGAAAERKGEQHKTGQRGKTASEHNCIVMHRASRREWVMRALCRLSGTRSALRALPFLHDYEL